MAWDGWMRAACAALALAAPGARADDFPSRFVTVIVPFTAGSGSDTGARIVG